MFLTKKHLLIFLRMRKKDYEEIRECCIETEEDIYNEFTCQIEVVERLIEDIESIFYD
ncbi:MAG: hypothetical protein RSC24_06505 [Clostridium sp.]